MTSLNFSRYLTGKIGVTFQIHWHISKLQRKYLKKKKRTKRKISAHILSEESGLTLGSL